VNLRILIIRKRSEGNSASNIPHVQWIKYIRNYIGYDSSIIGVRVLKKCVKSKAVPLHAMEALGGEEV
jgi:hypothetical protein